MLKAGHNSAKYIWLFSLSSLVRLMGMLKTGRHSEKATLFICFNPKPGIRLCRRRLRQAHSQFPARPHPVALTGILRSGDPLCNLATPTHPLAHFCLADFAPSADLANLDLPRTQAPSSTAPPKHGAANS